MHATREAWLSEAIEKLRPIFRNVGYPLPQSIKVEVKDKMASGLIGLCSNRDGQYTIAVHSELNQKSVIPVLIHEALHAAVGVREGHRGNFVKVGKSIGLWANESQPKSQYGPMSFKLVELVRMFDTMLGRYPDLTNPKGYGSLGAA